MLSLSLLRRLHCCTMMLCYVMLVMRARSRSPLMGLSYLHSLMHMSLPFRCSLFCAKIYTFFPLTVIRFCSLFLLRQRESFSPYLGHSVSLSCAKDGSLSFFSPYNFAALIGFKQGSKEFLEVG